MIQDGREGRKRNCNAKQIRAILRRSGLLRDVFSLEYRLPGIIELEGRRPKRRVSSGF